MHTSVVFDARHLNRVPSPLVGEGQGEGSRAAARGISCRVTGEAPISWPFAATDSSAPADAGPLTLPLSHKGRGDSVGTARASSHNVRALTGGGERDER
jgi:hypothetical protein